MEDSTRDASRSDGARPSREGAGAAADDALRSRLECVVLAPRPGTPPSERPPIDIFLGTEPAQYRANRAFVWSIEKVRDPGRTVRIHLLSELDGFDRRGWTTGFTNYRFAIPAYCGGRGRAIYNDEDQIYLTDPAELFDLDLEGAGYLAISDTESSVMLIDCERMASVWTLHDAQHRWKRALLRKASKATGHRGDLDPGWNARDEEFVPGESHLLHYTTLHTQPWRPFPERFVYQEGAHTDLWHALEREAIAHGFELFHRNAPSRGFAERMERQRALPPSEMGSGIGVSGELADAVEQLARRTKARTLLELSPDVNGEGVQRPGRFGLDAERRLGLVEWLDALREDPDDDEADGIICVDGLEALPVWDVPWIVDSLFQRAGRFVLVGVRCPESPPRRRFLLPPQGTTHTPGWWRSHFEAASRRHPGITWELLTARGAAFEAERVRIASGGPRPDATPPRVWTLTDGAPGNETQVEALVATLGWPRERIEAALGPVADLPFLHHGAHLHGLRADSRGMATLQADWPDLLIVAGRRVAAAGRWLREASRGRTRVVAIGAKAATPADDVDLAVTRRGAALFPHPHRIEVERPLVAPGRAPRASAHWRERLEAIRGPRIAVLLGSGTRRLGMDREAAIAFGELVAESALGLGASVLISASRHAAPEAFEGCVQGVGRPALVHHETRDQRPDERAWPAIREAADVFVYAGLGETTLAEICATGRPVFLAPQLRSVAPWGTRLRDRFVAAIVRRAEARPSNDRGTTRPQEGLELLCARLLERGWVAPRRDVETLRGRLVRSGHARLLRAPIRAGDLEGFAPPPVAETERVAARIRSMLGVRADATAPGDGPPGPDEGEERTG